MFRLRIVSCQESQTTVSPWADVIKHQGTVEGGEGAEIQGSMRIKIQSVNKFLFLHQIKTLRTSELWLRLKGKQKTERDFSIGEVLLFSEVAGILFHHNQINS